MVNEAALWAARHDKDCVEMEDFDYARDKILMGAKREEHLTAEDKEKTAYHEVGHTLASWFLKGADRVHKVTIIPRGRSLGSTQMLPEEDRVSMSETQLKDHLVVLLAGRAAEKLLYNETAVGAENDLERATSTARRMVTRWGMSEALGPVSYKLSDEDPFLGREIHEQRQFSEHTMEVIDSEVATLHEEKAADELLVQYREELENLTEKLVESKNSPKNRLRMSSAVRSSKTEEDNQGQIETIDDPARDDTAAGDDDTSAAESQSDSTPTESNDVSTNNQITEGESGETDTAPQSF